MSEHVTLPRFIIGDTETAGLGKMKIVCEVALMEIDPVTLEPINEWGSLIDPGVEIPEATTAIHGISNEMVHCAPTMAEFIEHNLGGRLAGEIILIAHNAVFDQPLLEGIGNIVGTICTLKLARSHVHGTENHKLQTLRAHFGHPENEAHRAMADVYTTRRVLGDLVRISGRTLAQMAATPSAAVITIPFGKHKGKPIMALPKDYLDYMLGLDLDVDLRKSMEQARRLK